MLQLEIEPFTPSALFSTSNQSHSKSVAIGDFNNDDYLDIIVANSGWYSSWIWNICECNHLFNWD